MTTKDVKQIIQELFRQNLNLYPQDYPIDYVGNVTQEAIDTAENVAELYYNNRDVSELERDDQLEITNEDYIDWCLEELAIWANEQTENK